MRELSGSSNVFWREVTETLSQEKNMAITYHESFDELIHSFYREQLYKNTSGYGSYTPFFRQS